MAPFLSKTTINLYLHGLVTLSLFLWAPTVDALNATGFQNQYYQAYEYSGSRIIEHGLYPKNLTNVTWSQAADLDINSTIWMVDKYHHVVVILPENTPNIPWHAFYYPLAGRFGESGYYDGSFKQALFDSPMGIAVRLDGAYIADTRNHCIRYLAFDSANRTITLSGHPSRPGLMDGDARRAKFYFPISIGLSIENDAVFVMSNGNRVRMYFQWRVTTLADGACRSYRRRAVAMTVYLRDVQCQALWDISETAYDIDVYRYDEFCMSHEATCGPRHHPGLQDVQSKHLRYKDGQSVQDPSEFSLDPNARAAR